MNFNFEAATYTRNTRIEQDQKLTFLLETPLFSVGIFCYLVTMTHYLNNKNILLGITGSIAAYKSADLVRRLREVGAHVRVVMTENAKRFITPLTMQAVSSFPVHDDLFDLQAEAAMGHIELARWADIVLVAPATADFMARFVDGNANDLLTTICLATKAPIALAPAMNQGMWKNLLTQENLKALQQKKLVHIFGPGRGSQACGDVGPGRMLEPVDIVTKVSEIFATGKLRGKKILVTAGPTHEAIDPIRYITNASSGKMGYALAEAAYEAGAEVILVSGPVKLKELTHIKTIAVKSAEDMHLAVMENIDNCDIFLGVAAVSDYRCETIAPQKIHKDAANLTLKLIRNPDMIADISKMKKKPFIVGFAAETEDLIEQAKAKRKRKEMDMIIANLVSEGIGMGADDNAVIVLTAHREVVFPLTSKAKLARELMTLIADEFRAHAKE